MKDLHKQLLSIRPTTKPKVMDLVEKSGIDVSDWSNFKGGSKKASANPRYCYEWCFEQDGVYVFNLWFEHIQIEDDSIAINHNYRARQSDLSGTRLGRSRRFDNTMRRAYENERNVRVVILDRITRDEGEANVRSLDPTPWRIVSYNQITGDFKLVRGEKKPTETIQDPILDSFLEGQKRQLFIEHRSRESRLRQQKIQQCLQDNNGFLKCEVPGCEFDFKKTYGEIGEGFAEIHHLSPLSNAPNNGMMTNLNDLAVVCSNCHAMIHRGGNCRDLETLIPGR
ncbi:MAG: HNH endonuclease [Roseibium sp.]